MRLPFAPFACTAAKGVTEEGKEGKDVLGCLDLISIFGNEAVQLHVLQVCRAYKLMKV